VDERPEGEVAAESKQFLAPPRPFREWWADEKAYYACLPSRVCRLCQNLAFAICIGTAVGLVVWCVVSLGKAYADLLLPGSYEADQLLYGRSSPEEEAIFVGAVVSLIALVGQYAETKAKSVRPRNHRKAAAGRSRRARRRRLKR
jgi:hypothetical protein